MKLKSPLDFERALLTKMSMSGGAIAAVLHARFTVRNFHDTEHAAVFQQVTDHYVKHGKAPGLDLIETYFPSFRFVKTRTPAAALVDELRERQMHVDMAAFLEEMRVAMDDGKPSELYDEYLDRFANIGQASATADAVHMLTHSMPSIWAGYEEAKNADGVTGIPWPWPTLNEATMGIHPEEYIVVTARPKVGKTWFMEVLSAWCFNLGYRVVFKTIEMAVPVIFRRLAAILCGLPYTKWRRGTLSSGEESRVLEVLQQIKDSGDNDLVVIGREPGDDQLRSLRSHCERMRPDVVFIDGAYLLASRRVEDQTDLSTKIKDLTGSLKVPLFASTQLNRKAGQSKETQLEWTAFSDAYGQDADLQLALRRGHEERARDFVRVDLPGSRESDADKFLCNWTLCTDFSEVDDVPDISTVEEDNGLADTE